jgi:hypothetical protein
MLATSFLPLEISNLIIVRGSRTSTKPLNLSQLSFHRVHQDEITQVGVASGWAWPHEIAQVDVAWAGGATKVRHPGGVALVGRA